MCESGQRAENRSRLVLRVSVLLIVTACSSGSGSVPPQLIPPEVSVRQIGGIGDGAARHVESGMSVNLQVAIINRSSEDLTVERMDVVSVGRGAYTVPRTSQPFERALRPDRTEVFDLWVATTTNDTILGVSGPVTLQLTVYYISPFGKFREVYTRNINTSQVRERRE